MSATTDFDFDAWLTERNALLRAAFNFETMKAYMAKYSPGFPLVSEQVAEITFHKSRTAMLALPREVRQASKAWLSERGYTSLDDGDLGESTSG